MIVLLNKLGHCHIPNCIPSSMVGLVDSLVHSLVDSLVDSLLGKGPGIPGLMVSSGTNLVLRNTFIRVGSRHLKRRPSHRATFSTWHVGASRKSPNEVPWEMLTQRLNRPISAPLLTVVLPWRNKMDDRSYYFYIVW